MPSHISIDGLLLAFTGVNCSPRYDMDEGWLLSFWGKPEDLDWKQLKDSWQEHILDRKPFKVEILLLQEFGHWYRTAYMPEKK